MPKGSHRFILSLRATGEGHISSITFRSGVIDKDNKIEIHNPTRYVATSQNITNPVYEKKLFERKLIELDLLNDFANNVLIENPIGCYDLINSKSNAPFSSYINIDDE